VVYTVKYCENIWVSKKRVCHEKVRNIFYSKQEIKMATQLRNSNLLHESFIRGAGEVWAYITAIIMEWLLPSAWSRPASSSGPELSLCHLLTRTTLTSCYLFTDIGLFQNKRFPPIYRIQENESFINS
jgi:hypothetical protein